MGQRVYDKAYYYVQRNNRKRLRQIIRRHLYLLRSDEALLVFNAIWRNPAILPWLLQRGVHADSRLGRDGNTPLMQAAADGDLQTMRLLLKHGADPTARNKQNETPLGFACAWTQWPAAELLLDNGADVNTIEDHERTFLDWATISGHVDGIELLRTRGGQRYAEMHSDRSE